MPLLLLGQIFLVGAILQTENATYVDVKDSVSDEVKQYDMKKPAIAVAKAKAGKVARDSVAVEPALPAAAPEVLNVTFRTEESYEIAEFELSQNVKIMRRNQTGKLLRMRVMPALKPLQASYINSLQGKFAKFAFYQTSKYSEMLFSSDGRIGNPYVASETSGVLKLCVPYQIEKTRFALPDGEKIVDGITYYRDRAKVGDRWSDVFLLRVEPFSDLIKVFPVLANEGIAQKEVLSSMTKRYKAVAAINGAYFTSRGDPIGTLIINRRLISSPLYKRSVFGVTEDDSIIFGNPDFSGVLRSGELSVKIDAVNQPRRGEGLVVFTPEYSRSTLTDEPGVELVLVKGKIVGIHEQNALIPPDGVVISAGGSKAAELDGLQLGQSVELDYSIDQPWNTIRHAVCGGPRLIENGRLSINGKEEKFDHSIVYGRHPRTAVALTFDGDLLMVVVDGRTQRNAGMKLEELATYLRTLGARHAINLDGGGSSSMIIKGRTVNAPSDGCERRISNGILVTNR